MPDMFEAFTCKKCGKVADVDSESTPKHGAVFYCVCPSCGDQWVIGMNGRLASESPREIAQEDTGPKPDSYYKSVEWLFKSRGRRF